MKHDSLMTSGFALLFVTAICQVQVAAQNKGASAVSTLAHGSPSAIERIETTNATLSLNAGSGDLIGLEWKHPRLEFIAEPRLGENFRILLPKPDYEANYFNSRDQVVRKIDRSPSGVVLHYGPLKNEREEVNVEVTYEIRDTGTQLQFSIQVDDGTDQKLAEVFYGIIGGQQGVGNRLDTESHVPGYFFNNIAPKLFSKYPIYSEEDIGVGFDSDSFQYPADMVMGWIDVYNPKLGLGYYYANLDREVRLTRLYTQLTPHAKSIASTDNWPTATALPADEPMGLTLGWINFPYTKRGIFQAGPIALQVHEGDWRTAARLHRAWFDQHYSMARQPNWIHEQMAWQMLLMSGNQDQVIHRFADLTKLAADAKQYGVTAMEILGWSVGGLERGYPEHRPDPRLGTREEFRQALAKMREIGVHPILFATLHLADTSTEDFRTRWSKYAVEGRFAPDWGLLGFAHGTLGARHYYYGRRLRRNFTMVSPSHPEVREYVMRQFLDRVRDGAEAIHFEGSLSWTGLDFNPNVPTSPDKSMPQGTLTAFAELLQRAREINPQFAMSVIAPYEAAIPYFDVNYTQIIGKDATSTAYRYAFPEMACTALTDRPWDFDRLNNGLRYGLVWVVGARQYTASMDEALTRPLSRYLRELIRIRGQFPDLLSHGRFSEALGANDPPGAKVTGDKDNIRYSMFQPMDPKDPARAAVVVNFGERDEAVQVRIDGREGREVTISVPFERDRTAVLPVKLTLPAHRAAVVVAEQ